MNMKFYNLLFFNLVYDLELYYLKKVNILIKKYCLVIKLVRLIFFKQRTKD